VVRSGQFATPWEHGVNRTIWFSICADAAGVDLGQTSRSRAGSLTGLSAERRPVDGTGVGLRRLRGRVRFQVVPAAWACAVAVAFAVHP